MNEDFSRKLREYEMKIVKMAGYLTDYYIDRAIESEDYSQVSGFLIDYFCGPAGKPFDVGYLVSKYKEFNLDEKIEDIDFSVQEWYNILYEVNKPVVQTKISEDDYVNYMIEKRKKDTE